LEGQVRYHIGGEIHEGGPGTFFHVPPGTEEHFEAAGDKPVRLLVLYTPGGIDGFFKEIGEPAQRHELPPRSETPPDLEHIAAVFVLSRAFVAVHSFAGVPAVLARVRRDGSFRAATVIPAARKPGRYGVTARCGGGNLGLLRILTIRR